MGSFRARAVFVVFEIVAILQACHYCMGAQVFSAGQSFSPDQYETSTENLHKVFTTQMIHIDHPDSPSSNAYNTSSPSERLEAAARRSLARRGFISRRLSSTGGFESEVMQDERTEEVTMLTEYSMALSIGTPPQHFLAWVHTSSDFVWVICKPCNPCLNGSYSPPFDPNLSSTYSPLSCSTNLCKTIINASSGSCEDDTCQYVATYGGTGALVSRGNLAHERLTVTNIDGWSTSLPIVFGCGRNITETMFFGADGIVGLGQSPFSLSNQIRNEYPFIFSYCLVPFHSSNHNTSTIFFGTPEALKLNPHLVYTHIITNGNSSYYYVPMTGISVDCHPLDLPPSTFAINKTDGTGGVLLDSGGSFTFLTTVPYTALTQELLKLIKLPHSPLSLFPVCFNLTNVSVPAFPTITFEFVNAKGEGKVEFKLAPENYISLYLEPEFYCLTILDGTTIGLNANVIGNLAQANHQIVYDRMDHKIGFASTDCSMA